MQTPRAKFSRLPVAVILLIQWAALLAGGEGHSLWIDEWFTVQNVAGPWASVLPKLIAEERRPPIYWLLLKTWSEFSGHGEFSLRLLSISFAAITTVLVWQLGRQLIGRREALLAAAAFALAPFVLLYGSMVRSYMLFAATATLSVLAWWACVQRPTKASWAGYVAALSLLLYTDYGAIGVFAAHGLWWLGRIVLKRERSAWRGVAALAAASVLFAPWAAVLLAQSVRSVGGLAADLASSPVGLVLKLVMPFISLSIGETLYPWSPLGAAGVLLLNAAAVLGAWRLLHTHATPAAFLLLWMGATLVFTATLLSVVAVDITFMNATSRAPHLAAAFALLTAAGIGALGKRVRSLAVGAVTAVWAAAFVNYFALTDYHNPIYAVPTREVAARMRGAGADSLIVAESDTLVPYYYRTNPGGAALVEVTPGQSLDPIRARIEREHPLQVQIAWFGRDRSAAGFETPALAAWLAERGYVEAAREEHGPVGDSYRWVKSRLVGRETYRAKLTIQVFTLR